jgi:hypothetical protein
LLREEALHRALVDRDEEPVLVAEVPRNRAAADARAPGDVGERRLLEPALAEDLLRRVEDAPPALVTDLVDASSQRAQSGGLPGLGCSY